MNEESLSEMLRENQIKQARQLFEEFGRIEKVFVNGGEVMPWHIDSVILEVVRNRERMKAVAISKINGVCTLKVAMQSTVSKRRTV